MLSQETLRLSELVRAKSEEIKGLKQSSENDISFKLSQMTALDETKNKLSSKLRQV